MEKAAYLVKITEVCELDDSIVEVIKWVKSEDLSIGNIEILDKRTLSKAWVWQNELYMDCETTKEPYAITSDYSVK